MSLRTAIWRVLLCISLILNGSVYAATSATMSLQQPGQPNAAQSDARADHPPCHGHQLTGVAKPMADQSVLPGSLPGKTGQPTPDCCHAGTCSSMCMHQAQVQMASNVFHAALGQVMAAVGHVKSRHAEPALPSLIRPPIN
ncbi:CopL family metal-binding regulatory protein [Cognatiluteimonas profundi]|uniref:CopL family metal-binding regulatory protein n=1 Tax=Cognatiluteimonas profundi TaxID=2594501 RepID=UPI003CCD74F6